MEYFAIARRMSLSFRLLQRFPAFLIHTSMQGVGTLFQRVGSLPKPTLRTHPMCSMLRKLSVARLRPTKLT